VRYSKRLRLKEVAILDALRRFRGLLSLIIPAMLTHSTAASAITSPGLSGQCRSGDEVVIEQVHRLSTQNISCLQPGDIVLQWSPFDLLEAFDLSPDVFELKLLVNREGKLVPISCNPNAQTIALGSWGPHGLNGNSAFAKNAMGSGEMPSPTGNSERDCWRLLRAAESFFASGSDDKGIFAMSRALQAATRTSDLRLSSQAWAESGIILQGTRHLRLAQYLLQRALLLRELAGGQQLPRARLLFRLGKNALDQMQLAEAESFYLQGVDIAASAAPDSLIHADLLGLGANLAHHRGQPEKAAALGREALAIRTRLAPGSIAQGKSFASMGLYANERGDLAEAEKMFGRAIEIFTLIEPGGINLARTFHNLGNISYQRGDFAKADDLYRKSLSLYLMIDRVGFNTAGLFTSLGNVAYEKDDLDSAEGYFTKALALKRAASGSDIAITKEMRNLGNVALARGDLKLAEQLYRTALTIEESKAPGSLQHAMSLDSLGMIAHRRDDLQSAKSYFNQALAIRQRDAPNSLVVAASLDQLGVVTELLGDFDSAESFYRRALAIRIERAPGSSFVAGNMLNLGILSIKQGRLDEAKVLFQKALEINEPISPLSVASSLDNLGRVSHLQGNLEEARSFYRRGVKIHEAIDPGTNHYLYTLHRLAFVEAELGREEEATTLFSRAVNQLELNLLRVGGSQDVQSEFLVRYQGLFHDYRSLLRKLGRNEEAFSLSERYRGQILLRLIRGRDMPLEDRLPIKIVDQIRKIDSNYDIALADLFKAISEGRGTIEASQSRIRELRDKKAFLLTEASSRMDTAIPNVHQLQLNLTEVLNTLDPGTIMLSYNVGPEQTDLFALRPGEALHTITIPIGAEALHESIEQMNSLLPEARSDVSVGAMRLVHLTRIARQLYSQLILPVEAAIQASDRVIILPDGPLHSLPWGLLVRPAPGADKEEQHFVEWKPFHVALSASLFSELKSRRDSRPHGEPTILAFGDPVYPDISAPSKELSSMRATRGLELMPLPGSRREVENILDLFPQGEAYLGSDATEQRAKSTLTTARNIHFAAHAVLDEGLPLNSAIVLSLPLHPDRQDADNGLLQAWEIFEQVRLDADLVVLSACESALGKELGGEGLISLTRAFQYAGARSVLASLWKISDRTTAELMVRFYKHLKAGKTKDEALRAAQIELIRGPIEITNEKGEVEKVDASAPYYWAAFQLYGDWQ